MTREFVIARNPDLDSSLPYLIRLPGWPDDPDVVERVPVRSCIRRGAAVEMDGRIVAAVERKSLADLVSTMTSGKLRYLLADLAAVPNAETRPLAQEWTFRFLGAALAHHHHDDDMATMIERSL